MYNEKLETLINAALADGVLTEKERQILIKNAQAQGIDLDEFEMVLNARLFEIEKAEQEKHQKSQTKKYGDVPKCPFCGAVVEQGVNKCPECGHSITVMIDQKLSNLLGELDDAICGDFCTHRSKIAAEKLKRYYGNNPVVIEKLKEYNDFLKNKEMVKKKKKIIWIPILIIFMLSVLFFTIYFFCRGIWWWGIFFLILSLITIPYGIAICVD